ncbi:MAG: 6-phosphofructokinase [Firmicutes bacterium]|nr:6-phosphofructokinase [Bacillota bacterium]
MSIQGNAVVAQSGGPTAVINNSVCGVVQEWLKGEPPGKLYGALFGIRGVLEENLLDLGRQPSHIIEGLRYTPGAALGSSRYRLAKEEDFARLLEAFKKHNIRYFFYIGGNDSMDTADKINRFADGVDYEIRVIGIPKTIDNDLPGTDHTPGYGSAAKFLAATVSETGLDLKGLVTSNRIVVLEAMGRNAGWLTAAAALAKREECDAPHLIYLPEVTFDRERFLKEVAGIYREYRFAYIVASEGIRYGDGRYVFAGGEKDPFGHVRLGGLADTLKELIEAELGVNVRGISLGTLQRSAAHFASRTDADEAYAVGAAAVQAALRGETDVMITLLRDETAGFYRCFTGTAPLSDVANVEKKVPAEWIAPTGSYLEDAFLRYAHPLIDGQVSPVFRNGLPDFVHLQNFDLPKLRRRLDRDVAGVIK